MIKKKILLSPIIGLLITAIVYNIFLPVICLADATAQSAYKVAEAPAHNTSRVIVSMGDSYSAGEGIEPFYGSRYSEERDLLDWVAHRSPSSYGSQLILPDVGAMGRSKYPESDNPHWYFVASSGAVTWDIQYGQTKEFSKFDQETGQELKCKATLDPQIDIFKKTKERQIVPDYITMTLGGNDLGFVDVLMTAAYNDYINPCLLTVKLAEAKYKLKYDYEVEEKNAKGETVKKQEDSIIKRLTNVYKEIDKAASIGDDHPCILVAGYPHLLNENLLNVKPTVGDVLNTRHIFTLFDAHSINEAIDLYNEELQNIVGNLNGDNGIRIEYVEIRGEFNTHEVNTNDPWINGIVITPPTPKDLLASQELNFFPLDAASLHPNIDGATKGYRKMFQEKINQLEGLDETPSPDPLSTESLIGSEISFGRYAGEDIKWTVLDETETGMFLLSKYAIESRSYNNEDTDIVWEDCSLREWLNGEFYESAFNSEEKKAIRLSYVQNFDNPEWMTSGGNDTYDRLYLLSIDEAEDYFATNDERMAAPTENAYNNAKAVLAGDDYIVLWWLRSPGNHRDTVAIVGNYGEINYKGILVDGGYDGVCGVRPALWVSKADLPETVEAEPTPEDQFTWSREDNHVTFGRYEQDGDLTNGKEPIEWEILSEEDGKMLLISLSILDSQPYDEDWSDDATWETCSLRGWLNNDFFNEAFSEAEADMIMTTTLQNPNNPIGGLGGNDTEDKVFILSVNEALSYYDQEDLYEYENQTYSPWFVREVTPYAISRGIWHNVITEDHYLDSDMYKFYTYDVIGMDSGSWWLRSPGNFNNTACLVFGDGSLGWGNFENSDDTSRGVRPVIWLDLNNMPVQADANVAAPIPDEVRDAYLDKANSVSDSEFVERDYDQPGTGDFTFDLVYINDDDIPELLICQNERNEYRGDRIRANVYTYKDGRVVEVIHTVLGECIDVGAYTYYYPRENLVRASYRISSSEQGVVVYRMSSDGEEAQETSYVVEYKDRESEDAPMEVTYSIYDRSDWSLIGEVSEEEFTADTLGTGEEVPLVASNTLEQFIEKLQ